MQEDDRRFWQQEVDLSTFVIGALSGALKFAPSIGRRMPVSVHTAPLECWRCRKETNIVIEIKFEIGKMLNGHPDITTTVYDFDEIYGCEDFLEAVFSSPLLK